MSYIFNPLQNEGFIPVGEQVNNNTLESYSYPPSVNPPIEPKKNYTWIQITPQGDWVEEWLWSGQHWLSTRKILVSKHIGGGTFYERIALEPAASYFIEKLFLAGAPLAPNNQENYELLNLIKRTSFDGIEDNTIVGNVNTSKSLEGRNQKIITTLNQYLSSQVQAIGIDLEFRHIGSPGSFYGACGLTYRIARS